MSIKPEVQKKIPNDEFNGAKQRIINDIPTEENYKEIDEFLKPYL